MLQEPKISHEAHLFYCIPLPKKTVLVWVSSYWNTNSCKYFMRVGLLIPLEAKTTKLQSTGMKLHEGIKWRI
jgi:hypothetical protein